MNCHYCCKAINVQLDYRRVRGWERKAFGGARRSGSDIILREPFMPEIWACTTCVDKQRRGIAPDQESLLPTTTARPLAGDRPLRSTPILDQHGSK